MTRRLPHAKAAQGLVLVPEGRQLFPDMSVYENLEMGAYPRRAKATPKENLEKVYDMLPAPQGAARPEGRHLSGGEQQMLAVARGLMAAARSPDVRRAVAGPGPGPGAEPL